MIDATITLQIEEITLQKFGVVVNDSVKLTVDKLEGDKFYMNATHHSIALTDVYAHPNEVITGVRFIAHPIQLQIQVHKYNFFTGELEKVDEWRSSSEMSLKKIPMENLEPRKDLKINTYKQFANIEFEFEPTAWETDLASHIVPYFNGRKSGNKLTPLRGLGMVYSNRTETEAGVITPRIHKYQFSELWVSLEAKAKEVKRVEVEPNVITEAGTDTTMIIAIAGASVVGIGALCCVVVRKRKVKSNEMPKDAPTIVDTVSFRANDKSSSEDTSSNEESSDDESDSSSSGDSKSSV